MIEDKFYKMELDMNLQQKKVLMQSKKRKE